MFDKSTTIHLDDIKIDLFEYIDENSDFLKNQYLEYVFEIGNLKLDNQKLRKVLEYNNHSLWEMSLINEKNIYKNNNVFKTIKYLALRKILFENINKKIQIFFLEKDLENIIKKEFDTKKLIFLNSEFSLKNKFKKSIIKSDIFNYLYFLYFFIKNCNFSKKNKSSFLKKKFFIFSYFTHYDNIKFSNGSFFPKQWSGLLKLLDKNFNFIQLFLPNKDFKFFFQIKSFLENKKINNLNAQNFLNNIIFFEYYSQIRENFKKFKTKVLFSEIENLFKKNQKYEFFFLINKDLFISSFSGYTLLQNLLWISVFDNLLSNIPKHDYGIFLYENQPWEKALITSWKKFKHGKLIGYSHTTINYWHLNYFNALDYNTSDNFEKFNPNYIAVSSQTSKNFLLNQSINSEKILEVEALRYLWILEKNCEPKKKRNKEILFLGDYKNTTNKKLIEILKKLKISLIDLGFNITFKPHPATFVRDIDKDIHQTSDDLELIVDRFDFVISSNTTSAIIEALSCGKTTFLFKDKNNFDLSPLKNTILEEKINFFYTDKDLLNKIDNNNDKIKPIKYYYLNKDLNRWKKILEIKN